LLGIETAHSPNAQDISTATWILIALAALFVIAVNVGLLVYLVRYRASRHRKPDRFRGSRGVQTRAAGALAVLAAVIFVFGVVYNEKVTDSPAKTDQDKAEAINIHAVGQQWVWRYEYPVQQDQNGPSGESPQSPVTLGPTFNDVFSYYELVVPVDTVVRVDLDSTDVVHRWWVPALGPKFEAVPGHTAHFEFKADDEGTYDGASTAFSGAGYATMRTRVRVVSKDDYKAWLTQQAADIKAAQTHVQEQLASGGPPGITSTESATEGTGQ
jgi:cytochrome c oxidase subunit II